MIPGSVGVVAPVVLVVVLLVVLVVVGSSSVAASAMNASTFASMVAASPVVLQTPVASAFAKLLEKLASHFATFAGSMVPPFDACFASSAHLQDVFLAAAL